MAKQPDQGWRNFVLSSLPKMEASAAPAATGFEPAPATSPQPFSVGMHLQPQFDPLELLPPAAAEKLRALRQRSADKHLLIPEGETVRQASLARIDAANALKRLVSHPQEFGFNLPETDARVIAANKHLAKMTADFERLRELQEVRTAAWQAASGALANVEDWLRHGKPGNCQIEEVAIEPPKLAKNDDLITSLDKIRRRGREIKASIHTVQSAPFPSKHAKACMREIVEQLATSGAPDVSLLIEHDRREIGWPVVHVRSEVTGTERSLAFHEAVDVVGLIAFLHKPALIAALDRQIDSEADDGASLSHEDRARRESEALSDLLAVEFEESSLVWKAQSEGLPVEHRSDCPPQAILGVQLLVSPRTVASPETSPGLSWPMRR